MQSHELAPADAIRPLSDEHYMLLVLDLANWRVGEEFPDSANIAWERLTSDTSVWTLEWATIRRDHSIALTDGALDFGRRARSALERFLTRDAKAIKAQPFANKITTQYSDTTSSARTLNVIASCANIADDALRTLIRCEPY